MFYYYQYITESMENMYDDIGLGYISSYCLNYGIQTYFEYIDVKEDYQNKVKELIKAQS